MSNDFLTRLSRLNRTAVFVATFVVLVGALFLPDPWGGFVLLALAVFMGLILSTTWAVQSNFTRVLRVTVLVLLTAVGLTRIW